MSNIILSIAIATYNSDDVLNNCILSIVKQYSANIEILIIDGNSSDNTIDIIKKYEDKIGYWVSEKDAGIYDAMNKAINNARGKYIYFMGSDDTLVDNSLTKLLDHLKTKPNELIVLPVAINSKKKLSYPDIKLPVPIVHHQGAIFHLESLKAIGLYSYKYKVHSDFDLICRYIKKYDIRYINNPICIFKKDGISTNGANVLQSMKELLHIYFVNKGKIFSIKWIMFMARPAYYYISGIFTK